MLDLEEAGGFLPSLLYSARDQVLSFRGRKVYFGATALNNTKSLAASYLLIASYWTPTIRYLAAQRAPSSLRWFFKFQVSRRSSYLLLLTSLSWFPFPLVVYELGTLIAPVNTIKFLYSSSAQDTAHNMAARPGEELVTTL